MPKKCIRCKDTLCVGEEHDMYCSAKKRLFEKEVKLQEKKLLEWPETFDEDACEAYMRSYREKICEEEH